MRDASPELQGLHLSTFSTLEVMLDGCRSANCRNHNRIGNFTRKIEVVPYPIAMSRSRRKRYRAANKAAPVPDDPMISQPRFTSCAPKVPVTVSFHMPGIYSSSAVEIERTASSNNLASVARAEKEVSITGLNLIKYTV